MPASPPLRLLCLICRIALVLVLPRSAEATDTVPPPLPKPLDLGAVLLTLSGEMAVTNDGDVARFDLGMIADLGTETLVTSTPWTQGPQVFGGVPLYRLMARVGAAGDTLFAEASNDYNAVIPMSDAVEGGAFLAFAINGEAMTLRNNGPLWLVYPFDVNKEFRNEVTFSRSIWQLDRLQIRTEGTE